MAICACDPGYDAATRAESHLTAGIEALTAGENDRAWALCDAARRLRPEIEAARRCAALAAVGWGRWDLAAGDLQALLEHGDSDAEPWIPVTLWLAMVRTGQRAGAIRLLDQLDAAPGSAPIRRSILALALAEGTDSPAWGFTEDRLSTWSGVLPLVRAGRGGTADLPPPLEEEGSEAAGVRALFAFLEGNATDGAVDNDAIPSEIRTLLTVAAGGTPALPVSGAATDPSMALVGRFFSEETTDCSVSEGLRSGSRASAEAALLEAICLGRRGDLDAALLRYEVANRLAPWHLVARLNRALLMARTGRYAAARAEMAHLSSVAPGHPILRVTEGILAAADGDEDARASALSELEQSAPAYAAWMEEVLAE